MYEETEVGIGTLPEQREFKGYSFLTEVLIPLAQAALAGASRAGQVGIRHLAPIPVACLVCGLTAAFFGVTGPWIWGATLLPVGAWLIGCGLAALSEFFNLVYRRMASEAKAWTADRPGAPAETREIIRYRFVFINGRKVIVEDATPPVEDAEERRVDPLVRDLATFVRLAANGRGLSKSQWCAPHQPRVTLPSGLEVSQPKWAMLCEELQKMGIVTKRGGAYVWAIIDPLEAADLLEGLAAGETEGLIYPLADGETG